MTKRSSISRRNLFAAGAVVLAALAPTRPAQARNGRRHHHGHGHGHGHGHTGGGANCYLRGTLIRTPEGEREVNDLRIGDLVVTPSGSKPIRWIGRRRLTRSPTQSWSHDVVPIKVAASALGPGAPHCDLFLSPGHALYLDGLLIQVGALVNGQTIVRHGDPEVIDYFQIELLDHDIVYANGVAAETFFAKCDRTLFDNLSEYEALYGSQAAGEPVPFAPELSEGGVRRQVRSRLRSAFSPWIDRRHPFDRVRDRIEERASMLA